MIKTEVDWLITTIFGKQTWSFYLAVGLIVWRNIQYQNIQYRGDWKRLGCLKNVMRARQKGERYAELILATKRVSPASHLSSGQGF